MKIGWRAESLEEGVPIRRFLEDDRYNSSEPKFRL